MGCDIHLHVEIKNEAGQWVSADTWEDEYDEGYLSVPYEKWFYRSRNYSLFGMLANVRNGVGFAGVVTGKPVVPLAEPRGLPENVSEAVRKASDYWGVDGHSHSWFTVSELMAYDWTQTITHIGLVNAPTYYDWNDWKRQRGDNPSEWCGGVSGPTTRIISEAAMKALVEGCANGRHYQQVKASLTEHERNTYCEVSWQQPYYKPASEFLSETLPRLWRLGAADAVRIVFWFDN